MSQHSVVVTFPRSKWAEYGQFCVPSFDEHWPLDVEAFVYLEGPGEITHKSSERVHFLDIEEILKPVREFEERNRFREIDDFSVNGDIKFQAAKFARKVFAQLDQLKNPKTRYVWYIDADCKTLQPITEQFLNSIVKQGQYVSYIDRPETYTETGLIVWDTEHPEHENWIKLYEECYTEDKIFSYPAWHDCYAFDHATRNLLNRNRIKMFDLGYGNWKKTSHPLVAGPLGKYFDHLKGERKFIGTSAIPPKKTGIEKIREKRKNSKMKKNKPSKFRRPAHDPNIPHPTPIIYNPPSENSPKIYTFLDPIKQEFGKRFMGPVGSDFILLGSTASPAQPLPVPEAPVQKQATDILPPPISKIDLNKKRLKEARLKAKAMRNARVSGGKQKQPPPSNSSHVPIKESQIMSAPIIPEDANVVSVQGILRGSGEVIKQATAAGIPWVYLDYGYCDKDWRVCINETAPTKLFKGSRFDYDPQLAPWRGGQGANILIIPPSEFYSELFGLKTFLYDVVNKVSLYTDKQIVVRPKPHKERKAYDLEHQLNHAYCVITWGSELALQCAKRGIPTISLGNCPAKPISFRFEDLETTNMRIEPNRHGLFDSLTWTSYNESEVHLAYDIVKDLYKIL